MTDCPACGSVSRSTPSKVYNGYQLLRCSDCSLIYTEQRDFPLEQYDDVYSKMGAYQSMKNVAHQTHRGEIGYKQLWWSKRLALGWWLKRSKPAGRLLDIGSGPGTFLMVANRQFKYDVQGVEPTAEAASLANSLGVPTFSGTLEQFEGQDSGKFDAMVSFEVLEHLANPLLVLTTARRLIKDDGVLIISVPNLDDPYCLDQQIGPAMPPVHINFFSRRSLGALLQRAGFAVEKTFSLPIPTSSVRNIYGKRGFQIRLPYFALSRLFGKQDGTTLLVQAAPRT